MQTGFPPNSMTNIPANTHGMVLMANKKPLYWSTTPFNYPTLTKVIKATKEEGDKSPADADEPNETNASADAPTFTEDQAKELAVLVQTDRLLDNPKFEPIHSSLLGLQEGAKVGALLGLPTSTVMMLTRWAMVRKDTLAGRPKSEAHPLLKFFGFKSFEHLANDGEDFVKNLPLKRLAKVVYGTGLSAAIGGLFFGPVVSYLIVANARTKIENIKRSIKNDYKDYKPDWIDKHLSHTTQVEDPIQEYNHVRQELTNKKDAAANGFHTAVFVKLLTLGSKIAGAALLGGLFEVGRHSLGYLEKVKDASRGANLNKDYFGEHSKYLELGSFTKERLSLGLERKDGNVHVQILDAGKHVKELEKLKPDFIKVAESLEKKSIENWKTYVRIHLKYSPVSRLLKETGLHLANPLMVANFIVTPAMVALGLIPFFVKDVGIEPYVNSNPEGSAWKRFIKGIRIIPHKESTEKTAKHVSDETPSN